MSLFSWLEGVVTIAFTLIPFFLIWACAVLWSSSRSAWEHLFTGIDLPALGYECAERVATPRATHVVLRKTP